MSISNAAQFAKELRERPQTFYIVHYSSESLYDDNEGLSPRVTSIAVLHFSTGQLLSFSAHVVAERLEIAKDAIHARYAEIESELLREFYDFARDRRADTWVHWNMDSITYGFELLEHRYVLHHRTAPPVIPVEQRVNLSWMLEDRYGSDYAPHSRMLPLMELNGGRDRHFLTGKEEIEAFRQHEFIRMHLSVLSKVKFFRRVISDFLRGKLRTASNSVGYRIDRLMESRIARVVALASAVIGIVALAIQAVVSLT